MACEGLVNVSYISFNTVWHVHMQNGNNGKRVEAWGLNLKLLWKQHREALAQEESYMVHFCSASRKINLK